jgi:hypothetical protein
MNRQAVFPVQDRGRVPLLLLNLVLRIRRAAGTLFLVVGIKSGLLDIMSSMHAVLEVRVLNTWLQKLADLLVSGPRGVDGGGVVNMSGVRAVVHMLVDVLPVDVQRGVGVVGHGRRGGAVVLAVGHVDSRHEGNSLEEREDGRQTLVR